MLNLFTEMALLLLLATAVGALGTVLRQPLIVSFIAVGILVGPSGLNLVTANDQIDLLAKLGISLLLFIVGLRLDLHIIRTMGVVALATGLGQVMFTSAFGFLIAIAMGMSSITALYVAVALTFSSTIIIVKLLSDKREIDTLHGRIALGFLIVQDIVAVLALIGLNAIAGATTESWASAIAILALKGLAFTGVIILITLYLMPRLLHQLARSQELLVLFGIAWAVSLAAVGDVLGFSKEVGAFAAGISLASTAYRDALGARLVTLRDFLLLFFFLDLGAHLDFTLLGSLVSESLIFSLFVLVGNPLIVMVIMGVLGYHRRTGFMAGLTVAQISEFSLILGALGASLGHITPETMGLITLVGLITISASTYLILYSQAVFDKLAPFLGVFEKTNHQQDMLFTETYDKQVPLVILFGMGRYGSAIARQLRARGCQVIGIDIDPELVRRGDSTGYPVRYGAMEDHDFLLSLPLSRAQWVLSTVPDGTRNLGLIKDLKELNYSGRIAVTVHGRIEHTRLEQAGADIVLSPLSDAGIETANRILTKIEPVLP